MSEFFIATPDGPKPVDGWVYKFIGIHSIAPDSWSVTHVPSGHRFGVVSASLGCAKLIVKELAAMTDWGAFNGIDGWRNTCPELPRLVREFASKCEEFEVRSGRDGSREIAMQVAERVGA